MQEHSLDAHIKVVKRSRSGSKTDGPTGGNQPSGTKPQAAERQTPLGNMVSGSARKPVDWN